MTLILFLQTHIFTECCFWVWNVCERWYTIIVKRKKNYYYYYTYKILFIIICALQYTPFATLC